jgi:O-antigen/teichoic acid export membrane protein
MISFGKQWLQRLFDLAANRSAPATDRERRSRSVVRGTATAVLARGIAALTGFIIVPLTVGYLGPSLYGAWMAVGSVVVFFSFTDFGIAASLTNALSRAFGEKDHVSARTYVSTSLIVLSATAALLLALALAFSRPLADLIFPTVGPELRKYEIVPALIAAVAIFALNFPLLVVNRVLAAYQETSVANLWGIAANIANLASILIVIRLHGNLPVLVLASGGAGLFVNVVSAVWLFGWRHPLLRPGLTLADMDFLRDLWSSGWRYFVVAVAVMINFQTDNLVISRFLGPSEVTPYSVTFRLFAYSTLVQQFFFASLWPAYAEAAARKDIEWVRGVLRKNLKGSLAIAILILAMLCPFGRQIIRWWAGPAAVPGFAVIIWMTIWNLMLAHLYPLSCLLEATGNIRKLSIYVSVTAILNIIFSVFLVTRFGISGVIAGTVLAYAVCSYPLTIVDTRRVLRQFA